MDVRVGLWRELRADKLMLLNLVLEKSLKSPLDCKDIQPVHPKGDQSWVFIGRTDAEAEIQYFGHLMWTVDSLEKTLMLGGIGGRSGKGWDCWMASPAGWTWVWVNSSSWWWTGRPGVLWFMGSQSQTRLSDLTELNWTKPHFIFNRKKIVILSKWHFEC